MNRTNYHSHSTFCDGHATMEEFVQAAIAMGYTSYGFSSHAPLPYHTRWNMDAENLEAYFAEANRLKIKYNGIINLYVGLEIDYLNEQYNPTTAPFVELPLDFAIGSVHTVLSADGIPYEVDGSPERFRVTMTTVFHDDIELVVRQYFKRELRLLELGGFDIVGHVDKIYQLAQLLRTEITTEFWYNELVNQCFTKIVEHNYIVEMNTKAYELKGLFFPEARHYPALHEMGIRIVVNSDAHYPQRIDSGRYAGLKLLKDSGYTHVAQLENGQWTDVEIDLN